ncbi:spore coat associated protein CotJA [Eubacteriales bacterium OttesenSCG-928-K08]|nr:spore coat associated protein CotJA [Eubacteriales bacterium OttesenSCG-928-K08]
MQPPAPNMRGCCFESCGCQLDPLEVRNTLPAGDACNSYRKCDPCDMPEPGCLLAQAYIPMQEYQAGFCANEALCQGTFFPELVRPFVK